MALQTQLPHSGYHKSNMYTTAEVEGMSKQAHTGIPIVSHIIPDEDAGNLEVL